MSQLMQRKLDRKLRLLEKKADKLHAWLMKNISDPHWVEKKREWNLLTLKIDNLKKQLNSPSIWKQKTPELSTKQYSN